MQSLRAIHQSRSRRAFLRPFGLAAGAVAFGTPVLAADATNVLRCSLPNADNHPTNMTMAKFAGSVAQRTNGALRIEIFANGSLAKEQPSIAGLQTGTVDMTAQTTAYLETMVPKLQILDLPFLFSTRERAEHVLDGPIGRELFSELVPQGIVGLVWGTTGWRELEFRDKDVTRPDDMRGLRMRIQNGPVYVSMMKALGAIPVVIDFSETYLALQQKAVDGIDFPLASVLATKWYDVTKHASLTNHLYNPQTLLVSKQRYDALPRDQQQAIQSAAAEILPQWRSTIAAAQTTTTQDLRAKGMTFSNVDFAAFRRAMNPVYADFREKLGTDFFDRVVKEAGA